MGGGVIVKPGGGIELGRDTVGRAVGVESLHINAVVSRVVATPHQHIGAIVAHGCDLRLNVITPGVVRGLEYHGRIASLAALGAELLHIDAGILTRIRRTPGDHVGAGGSDGGDDGVVVVVVGAPQQSTGGESSGGRCGVHHVGQVIGRDRISAPHADIVIARGVFQSRVSEQ